MEEKGFVWWGTRVCLFLLLGSFALGTIFLVSFAVFPEYKAFIFFISDVCLLFFCICSIFNILLSIIHLNKYKNKTVPVISLIITSILILLFISTICAGAYIKSNNTIGTAMNVSEPLEVKSSPAVNEYSDGQIFFTKPTDLKLNKEYSLDGTQFYVLSKENETGILVSSDLNDITSHKDYFDLVYNGSLESFSQNSELYYDVINEEHRTNEKGFEYIQKSIRIYGEKSDFILIITVIFDNNSNKIAKIDYFSPETKTAQYSAYLDEVLKSIRFS